MNDLGPILVTIMFVAVLLWILPKLCRLVARERVNNAKIKQDTEDYNKALLFFKQMEEEAPNAAVHKPVSHELLCAEIRQLSIAIAQVSWRPLAGKKGTLYVRLEHGSLYFNQDIYIQNVKLGQVVSYIRSNVIDN